MHPHLDHAKVIACFDADPFFDHPAAIPLARQFAEARQPSEHGICRLWVAEPAFTITGGRADHRQAVPESAVPRLLAMLARELVATHDLDLSEQAGNLEAAFGTASADGENFVTELAVDLMAHRGAGVILVGPGQAGGGSCPGSGAQRGARSGRIDFELHRGAGSRSAEPHAGHHRSRSRMNSGSVETLLILGGNPVYDAPADLGFADLLAKVPNTVHLSLYDDETS